MLKIKTVYDIAKAAGVSVATVSRVLNGFPNVAADTRERVLALIQKSGFRPNVNARRLVHGRSGQVCFLLSNRDVVHSFHSRILMGAADYCRQKGHHVVFAAFEYGANEEYPNQALPPIIHEHGGVEGLLLAGVNYPPFLNYIESLGIRYVLFGNNLVTGSLGLPRQNAVCFDEKEGARQAAAFLLQLGHTRATFVGDRSRPWYERRFRGFEEAMRAARQPAQVVDLHDQASAFHLGAAAVPVVLRDYPETTAIVAQDDETACGVLDSLRRLGVRVPEDLSVVGYDDITEIQYLHPALTTVRVAKEKIGWAMADLLYNPQTAGRRRGGLVLPTELVIRDSCRKLESGAMKTISAPGWSRAGR
jgi:DNA-binding LacI/PurR family transcriptional regulator